MMITARGVSGTGGTRRSSRQEAARRGVGGPGGLGSENVSCAASRSAIIGRHDANLLRNFISFYHQAYRAVVWSSRHEFIDAGAEFTRLYPRCISATSHHAA